MDGFRVFSGVAAFAFKFERSNDLRSRDMPFFVYRNLEVPEVC